MKVLPGEYPKAAHRGCPPADPGASLVAAVWPPPRRGHRRAAGGGTHILPARREFCFHIAFIVRNVGPVPTGKYKEQEKRKVKMALFGRSIVLPASGKSTLPGPT